MINAAVAGEAAKWVIVVRWQVGNLRYQSEVERAVLNAARPDAVIAGSPDQNLLSGQCW